MVLNLIDWQLPIINPFSYFVDFDCLGLSRPPLFWVSCFPKEPINVIGVLSPRRERVCARLLYVCVCARVPICESAQRRSVTTVLAEVAISLENDRWQTKTLRPLWWFFMSLWAWMSSHPPCSMKAMSLLEIIVHPTCDEHISSLTLPASLFMYARPTSKKCACTLPIVSTVIHKSSFIPQVRSAPFMLRSETTAETCGFYKCVGLLFY